MSAGRRSVGRLVAALAVLWACGAVAAGLKLAPVDEADRDPTLVKFRTALLAAVERRDVKYVVARADPKIRLSFGDDIGRKTFSRWLKGKEEWQGEAYWRELEMVLKLGGVFTAEGEFCTPYVSCMDVPGCPDCDPFETVFAVNEASRVYAHPDANAPILAELAYAVLTIAEDHYPWYKVRLSDGVTGFVTGPDFRSPVDYRAGLSKKSGRWRIRSFIAGD